MWEARRRHGGKFTGGGIDMRSRCRRRCGHDGPDPPRLRDADHGSLRAAHEPEPEPFLKGGPTMPNVAGRPFAWLAVFGGLLSLGFAAGGGCGEWARSTSTAWGLGLLLVVLGTTISVAASRFEANENVLRRALNWREPGRGHCCVRSRDCCLALRLSAFLLPVLRLDVLPSRAATRVFEAHFFKAHGAPAPPWNFPPRKISLSWCERMPPAPRRKRDTTRRGTTARTGRCAVGSTRSSRPAPSSAPARCGRSSSRARRAAQPPR